MLTKLVPKLRMPLSIIAPYKLKVCAIRLVSCKSVREKNPARPATLPLSSDMVILHKYISDAN